MKKIDKDHAIDLLKRVKGDIRAILDKYAVEAAKLSINSADPHSPVIGIVQMALANAAVDYMCHCGAVPMEGFEAAVSATGNAMEQWVNAVMKQNNIQTKPPEGAATEAKKE